MPAGHSVQLATPRGLNQPLAQADRPSSESVREQATPAGQGLQDAVPPRLKEPAGQGTRMEADAEGQ